MDNLRFDRRQAGRARSRTLATRFGTELRIARVTAGLSQQRLATLAGVGQNVVSRAERGDHHVSLDIRCRLAAAAGHEIGLRLYPVASVRLRDSGQLGLAQAIALEAPASWEVRLEVPVARDDPRAADMLLIDGHEVIHIEIERAMVDVQAQLRSAQLKRAALAERSDRPVRLVIALPESRVSRERLAPAADLLSRALPKSSRDVWTAIRTGKPLDGDGILFVRARRRGNPG